MSGMEKIATDIFTFKDLRTAGFVYVDKTDIIRSLADLSFGKQFFLSRPRRFGKSLLISTLRALFEGERELFAGLAIEPKWDWAKTWPVIHLDMGSCQADTAEGLWDKIRGRLRLEAERHGVPLRENESVSNQFQFLMVDAIAAADRRAKEVDPQASVSQCVLLVDEYDKPLLGHLGTPEVTPFKNALKEFYSVIKTCEGKQRFTLITGVSKFSKVSIFSDLNNLTDLSMDARTATLLGYTREELKAYFADSIAALAEANAQTPDEAFARMERMYDGFRFHANAERVFNPVSVGKCLATRKYGSYWFESGTPSFLIEMFKREPIGDIEIPIGSDDLSSSFEPEQLNLLPLMYQTGYLTIRAARTEGEETVLTLGYPNAEVERAMSKSIALGLSHMRKIEFSSIYEQIYGGLVDGEPEEVLEGVKCFFENIPYDLQVKYEKYYQSLFYSIFLMLKARVDCEVKTARGRIDAVIETPKFVYVFEFKIRGTSEEALAQIKEKGYADRFATDPRRVFKIGCAFDWETRNLGNWLVED